MSRITRGCCLFVALIVMLAAGLFGVVGLVAAFDDEASPYVFQQMSAFLFSAIAFGVAGIAVLAILLLWLLPSRRAEPPRAQDQVPIQTSAHQ